MHRFITAILLVVMSATTVVAEMERPARRAIQSDTTCVPTSTPAQCMKCAIYHEARGESVDGQIAVALVIYNRVASPRYPNNVCEVVWQKGFSSSANRYYGQFSFTTDGKSDTMVDRTSILDAESSSIAATVIYQMGGGENYIGVGRDVLWYHTSYVSPSWSVGMTLRAEVGAHQFFAM